MFSGGDALTEMQIGLARARDLPNSLRTKSTWDMDTSGCGAIGSTHTFLRLGGSGNPVPGSAAPVGRVGKATVIYFPALDSDTIPWIERASPCRLLKP